MRTEDEITIFEVGKPIPIKVQDGAEGGQLGLVYDLMFLLHFPNLRRVEKRIFEKGFKRYGYLELGGSALLAIWRQIFRVLRQNGSESITGLSAKPFFYPITQ